jgi:hypothetical protein
VGGWTSAGSYELMAGKQEYLKRLQEAIQQQYKCRATHRRTVAVHEVVKGKTVWNGNLEVFWLTGHPGAKRCFAWSCREGETNEQIVAILENPPVIGPATAVRTAIAAEKRR